MCSVEEGRTRPKAAFPVGNEGHEQAIGWKIFTTTSTTAQNSATAQVQDTSYVCVCV